MTGFLCFYKRSGITSFKALAELRHITGEKKLGHTGTLDPMAEGVLPAAFGRASKFIELLPDQQKAYTADFRLGVRTDTLDSTGTVTEQRAVRCSEQDVIDCLPNFVGDIMQVPPMYSAVSVNGVRLYQLARQGAEIERRARPVHIDSITYCGRVGKDEYQIHVACGKGTYIRTLIDDIGAALGCGAMMTRLVRTSANGFDIRDAVTVEQLSGGADAVAPYLIPVDRMLQRYARLDLSDAQTRLFRNGAPLDWRRLPESGDSESGLWRVYAPDGRFLGVGEADAAGFLRMRKLFDIL